MVAVPCYRVDNSCLCQIPNTRESASPIEFITVLDCSGSMHSYWPSVARAVNTLRGKLSSVHTVVFHSAARQVHGHVSEDLNEIGTGGTNIPAGIDKMKDLVSQLRTCGSERFLIIFVSDGQNHQLLSATHDFAGHDFDASGMEFTTVGVGPYFPAHISMALRRAFHHGRVNIPNVTLVEKVNELYGSFTKMTDELLASSGKLIGLSSGVQVAPWEDIITSAHEKSWIILKDNTSLRINVDDGDIPIEMEDCKWTFSTGESILTQWMNMLHRHALSGVDVRPLAHQAEQFGEKIAQEIELAEKRELGTREQKNPSVWQRLQKNLRTTQHLLLRILKELRLLANGDILSNLSDADLAQRLAIGTQEGKHHKRALKWKGISHPDFEMHVKKFEKIMNEYLQELQSGPADEDRSAVSLESNGDILLQEDLMKAIKALPSQYHLVECVPVVGQPILIETTNASMINPWMINVKSISRVCSLVDTCTLQEMANTDGLAQFSLGGGDVELVNAVCPLFSADLAQTVGPFFRSGLYSMLMTHVVCKNIDTLDKDCHPALLAAMFCHMLDLPASTWRDNLVAKFAKTFERIYFCRFSATLDALKDDPKLAMITEHPSLKSKCQALSKPMALTLCLGDRLSTNQKKSIVQRLYLEHIGRILGSNPRLLDWFTVSTTSERSKNDFQLADLNIDVPLLFSEHAVKKAVRIATSKLDLKHKITSQIMQMKVELNVEKLQAASKFTHSPVNLFRLRKFSSWILGEDTCGIPLSSYVFHGCTHKNSYDRAMHQVLTEAQVEERVLSAYLGQEEKEFSRQIRLEMEQHATALYIDHYTNTHQEPVLPMKWSEIAAVFQTKGEVIPNPMALGYDESSGLCSNCCMNPSCTHYLVPTKHLNLHLETERAHGTMVEAFHRCIRNLRHKSLEDIEQALMSGEYMTREPRATYFDLFASHKGPALRVDIRAVRDKCIEIFG